MSTRNDALEEAARMLDDMARDWNTTADRHSERAFGWDGTTAAADAARDAARVASTYTKAARKVRDMKREST